MFCYQVFMEDVRLQQFKTYFQQKWLEANTTLGIGLLRSEQIAAARPYFWQALNQQKFNVRTLAALTLSFTPQVLASKLMKIPK
jgi:hypothetical protein